MLSVFDRNNPFTKYEKDLIVNLSSDGMILLELVASFENKRSKSKEYTVEYIREKFNRTDSYSKIAEFNRNILDKAISELKKYTPYEISYEGKANGGGRAITHYVFTVSKPNQPLKVANKLKPDINKQASCSPKVLKKGLTVKQIGKLAFNKEQFVLANQHMISDKTHDFYQALNRPEIVGDSTS